MNNLTEFLLSSVISALTAAGVIVFIVFFLKNLRASASISDKLRYEPFSCLLIDVGKTKENTEMIVKSINEDINNGKLFYIDRILLFDSECFPEFAEAVKNVCKEGEKTTENLKMCEIISRNYSNVFFLR